MKRFELLCVIGLLVGGTPPAPAQTPNLKPADLVGLWKGDVVEKRFKMQGSGKSVGWLRLRPDSLFWQWNTRTYPVQVDKKGTKIDQVSNGGIAGRWTLACDSICTLRLVHEERYNLGWGEAQFYGLQQGNPNPDTVGMGRLPTVEDSLQWVKMKWTDMFVQQVYVYKVTLADQQLTLVEVDRKLQRTGGLPASGHEWLQEATFKRQ